MISAERPGDLPLLLRPAGLALVVLALTLLKLWSGTNAHFVEDEAYYRLWGLNPALGYYDHPPMIAWWIHAGQWLLGDTVLAVRLFVILSSVVGSLALWRSAFLMAGPRAAGWSVLFLNASLLVGIGGILATPDAPSVLFWGLAFWALTELSVSRNAVWWLAVGVFAGLGLASKYSVLFLGAGIVLWLLWVPENRRWLACWQLWAGGALALLLFAPVLVWNQAHEWVSFYKQFGRAGRGSLTAKHVGEFLGGFIGLLNPLIAVAAGAGSWALLRRAGRRDPLASLVLLTSLPFLVYLLYHSLHARVQANWPAPLFPALALIAAVWVAQGQRGRARFGAVAVALGLAVTGLVQVHAVHPLTGAFARKDPTFQLRGWPEVGAEIKAQAEKAGAAYVLTTSYALTGQLDYLLRDRLPVAQMNERIRYIMGPAPDPSVLAGTGLYVTTNRRDNAGLLHERFAEVELVDDFPRQVKGVELERMRVYRLADPLGPVLDPVEMTQPE